MRGPVTQDTTQVTILTERRTEGGEPGSLITPVLLCGGSGSRLWPLSREDNPKQFHNLAGESSMLVKTIQRMAGRRNGEASVFLIAAERHAGRISFDLAGVDLKGGRSIFEPVGRNTAAAVARNQEPRVIGAL